VSVRACLCLCLRTCTLAQPDGRIHPDDAGARGVGGSGGADGKVTVKQEGQAAGGKAAGRGSGGGAGGVAGGSERKAASGNDKSKAHRYWSALVCSLPPQP